MAREDRAMRITFFSRFSITDAEKTVSETDISSNKLTKLLAYICDHADRICTNEELSDALWNNEDVHGPSGALKNLMYRLRSSLKKFWPEKELIMTGKGHYQWNPRIPVTSDVAEFTTLLGQADRTRDVEKAIRLRRQAVDLYKGRFLADYADDLWVISRASYFHGTYLAAVQTLAGDYREQERFIEMQEVCEDALMREPLDEMLMHLCLEACIGQARYEEVAKKYEEFERLLYDRLGISPSEQLRELYIFVKQQLDQQEQDLQTVQFELRQSEQAGGAFFCEYGVFKKVYEIEARRLARMGMTIFVALITVEATKGTAEEADPEKGDPDIRSIVRSGADQLHDAITSTLRSGDVFTRYSYYQYLIMLPGCSRENTQIVLDRISGKYYDMLGHAQVSLNVSAREMRIKE